MSLIYSSIDSNIGKLAIIVDNKAVVAVVNLSIDSGKMQRQFASARLVKENDILARTADLITQILAGKDVASNLPLRVRGSNFQHLVWQEIGKIPRGTTVTYKDIAMRIGRVKSVRAVGNACGANPVPLLVPCHRVIRSNGDLGGFGWGAAIKRRLLSLESGCGYLPACRADFNH